MSKGKMVPGYQNYRKSYNPKEYTIGLITSYYQCLWCKKQWYSKDGIGFLQCPYCKVERDIHAKMDTSNGKLPLDRWNGQEYSTKEV